MRNIIDFILGLNLDFVYSFGYILLFLLCFIEGAVFLGILIPGTWVVFFGGFLARITELNIWVVIALVISGAILGDLVGYLIGRYFGKEMLHKHRKLFLLKESYLEKVENIVHGHTGKALIIGRFNPLTRSAAPFIVGAHRVPFLKFMFFNVIGGFFWGFSLTYLGFIFGSHYAAAQIVEKYILMSLIGIFFIIYLFPFIKGLLGAVRRRVFDI